MHRSSMRALAALTIGLALAGLPAVSRSQIIDSIEVTREGSNAQVFIRFQSQIQYLRHAPTTRADLIQVFFQLVGADENVLSTREDLRRSPPNDLLPRFEVNYRAPLGLFQRRIDIRFAEPVEFDLRPDDKRTILLTIPLPPDVLKRLGAVAPAPGGRLPPPAPAPVPPGPPPEAAPPVPAAPAA